jgi:hypothetical protein
MGERSRHTSTLTSSEAIGSHNVGFPTFETEAEAEAGAGDRPLAVLVKTTTHDQVRLLI